MRNRKEFISLVDYGWHKGFYNDEDFSKSLMEIEYTDFFDKPDDEDFLFDTAHDLLRGSCHHFAWAAQRVLGYQPYIIEQIVGVGFHVLCQVYKNRKLYYALSCVVVFKWCPGSSDSTRLLPVRLIESLPGAALQMDTVD